MGGEGAKTTGLSPEPEQATPQDELEVAAQDGELSPGKHYPLVIRAQNDALLVMVDDQGVLTYGEGYEPDETARIFWEAITAHMPENFKIQEPEDTV